jgi:hypothetical protein
MYNYDKIIKPIDNVEKIKITNGQIEYEFNLLQDRLEKREPKKYEINMYVKEILPHPLFTKVEGLPEYWEKSYWRNKE